jgi:hypothetical protein
MLFRCFFQDIGNSVLIDPLPFQHFQQYARSGLKLDLYELPSHLQFKSLLDIGKLHIYLEAISPDYSQNKPLFPSRNLISVEQLEKRVPQLIEQQIEVEYKEVKKKDLIREISLKETWDWEVKDASWELLNKQFAQFLSAQALSSHARHQVLDQLDAKTRLEVDAFAQACMIDQDPERVQAALDRASLRQAQFGLRSIGKLGPFDQIKNREHFLEQLRTAPLDNKETSSFYDCSEDQGVYYWIHLLSRSDEHTVLNFVQADEDGTLDRMLEKRLEEAYPEIRRKNRAYFQRSDGTWKPLKEVKEKVCKLFFPGLFKAIEDSQPGLAGLFLAKEMEVPSSFYTQYCFYPFLTTIKKQLEENVDSSSWVQTPEEQDRSLLGQWKLIKTSRTVERNSDFIFAKEQMFQVPVNGWSPVEIGSFGSIAFYQVIAEMEGSIAPMSGIEKSHDLLSADAKRHFLSEFLETIQQKKAIQLASCLEER